MQTAADGQRGDRGSGRYVGVLVRAGSDGPVRWWGRVALAASQCLARVSRPPLRLADTLRGHVSPQLRRAVLRRPRRLCGVQDHVRQRRERYGGGTQLGRRRNFFPAGLRHKRGFCQDHCQGRLCRPQVRVRARGRGQAGSCGLAGWRVCTRTPRWSGHALLQARAPRARTPCVLTCAARSQRCAAGGRRRGARGPRQR